MTETTTERGAVAAHSTGTSETPWSASTHEGRLASPMPVATARREYAWFDSERVENGEIVKEAASLPHHEVSENGSPGVANLPAVRNALARLPQSNIPTADHETVRSHLRGHLDGSRGGTGFDQEVVRVSSDAPELRAVTDGRERLTGHFSVFNTWYEVHSIFEGRFLERTAPGAFADTIASDLAQVKVTFNHGRDVLGDQVLGPIEVLEEDEVGPRYEVPLLRGIPELLLDGLRNGVYGSSFRFRVTADEWDEEPGESDHNPLGLPERTVTKVRLFEFGPVTFPANPDATAGIRSMTDEHYEALRERDPSVFEDACRSAMGTEISTGRPDTRSAGGGGVTGTDPGHSDDPAGNVGESPPEETQPPNPQRKVTTVDTDTTFTVEERRVRQSEIRTRMAEIDETFGGNEMNAEARTEWDNLKAEYDEHRTAIEDAEERRAELAEIAENPAASEGPTQRRSRRPSPGWSQNRTREPVYDLSEIRRQARSVDELPALYRDNALRAIEAARFPTREVKREDAQSRASELLETVDDDEGTIARRIVATGGPVYQRAFGKVVSRLSTIGLTSEEERALSVGTDAAGGFAVPFQLDPTIILTSDGRINPLRDISRVVQVTGKEWQGVTSAGITVSRGAEGDEADDNSPTLAQPTVRPTRVQGFVPFSRELETTWSQLQTEITGLLGDAKAEEEAESFTNGDGVAPSPGGVVGTLAASSNVDVSGGGVTSAQLYDLETELPPRFRTMARFVANKRIFNEIRQLDTAGGADLWVRLADGLPPELIGYPAHELSTMTSDSETADERYLLFGDFRQFLIVDQIGMSIELVPHLFGANGRPTGQRGIYAIWSNSSVVLVDNAFRILNATL